MMPSLQMSIGRKSVDDGVIGGPAPICAVVNKSSISLGFSFFLHLHWLGVV